MATGRRPLRRCGRRSVQILRVYLESEPRTGREVCSVAPRIDTISFDGERLRFREFVSVGRLDIEWTEFRVHRVATMGGLEVSQAISGYPTEIVGETDI